MEASLAQQSSYRVEHCGDRLVPAQPAGFVQYMIGV